jgi:ribosomal protein S12 methylthiotransferase accessory factor
VSPPRSALAEGNSLIPLGDRERTRLARLLGLWNILVDPKVGIVREVRELVRDDDDPDFFHYLSRACNTARFTAMSNFGNNGGVSVNRYAAMAKALGEAVERYCSAIFDYRDLVYAPYSELEKPATRPGDFALYRADQFGWDSFRWKPFTDDSPIAWTVGRSLVTGEEALVPAAMVYVPYHYVSSRSDTPIVQPISTGLACGHSFSSAALAGLCEAIERDAFTLTWQARLSRPHIVPDSLPPSVRDILRRYAEAGLSIKLMDITSDIAVPSVLSIALSDAPTSPAVAVAAASASRPERALIQCLEELAHTRKFAKQVMEFMPAIPPEVEKGHPGVQDQRDHLRFYCPQSSKSFVEFCWDSTDKRRFEELPSCAEGSDELELETAVAEVARNGLDPVACDLTTPDVRALGLSVIRVVVPGLHPLFMGHGTRALGGTRLYTVPEKLGHRGLEPRDLGNPYPHPFP